MRGLKFLKNQNVHSKIIKIKCVKIQQNDRENVNEHEINQKYGFSGFFIIRLTAVIGSGPSRTEALGAAPRRSPRPRGRQGPSRWPGCTLPHTAPGADPTVGRNGRNSNNATCERIIDNEDTLRSKKNIAKKWRALLFTHHMQIRKSSICKSCLFFWWLPCQLSASCLLTRGGLPVNPLPKKKCAQVFFREGTYTISKRTISPFL